MDIYTKFQESEHPVEMVFGLVYPLGINRDPIIQALKEELSLYNYELKVIRVSEFLDEHKKKDVGYKFEGVYLRTRQLMKAGNEIRKDFTDDILARAACVEISRLRVAQTQRRLIAKPAAIRRTVYLVDSIKHRKELEFLRGLYANGFYLIAINSPRSKREALLLTKKGALEEKKAAKQVRDLMDLDQDDVDGHGQEVGKVFHLGDYFLDGSSETASIQVRVERFLRMVFNDPFVTPTFEEYAMHLAYIAATKTADLSRQVGAVIARDQSILSLGANEVPKYGGGTYWPTTDQRGMVVDVSEGRDYTRLQETNKAEIQDIKVRIFEGLKNAKLLARRQGGETEQKKLVSEVISQTRVDNLTEFGRMMHAEMDALLECARRGIPTLGAEMYATTFPCHNCAKHIIGAGIQKVVYIEPYQKSKAPEFHDDSCEYLDSPGDGIMKNRLVFTPFQGLGPRYYIMLFSMIISPGAEKKRRDKTTDHKLIFNKAEAMPRLKMLPQNYLQLEEWITHELTPKMKKRRTMKSRKS